MSSKMVKKVAIITYSRAYNYGSALQTFALNCFLRSLGNDVKTIDYTTRKQRDIYKLFEPITGVLSVFRNVHSLMNYSKLDKHKKNFDEFLSRNVPMTAKTQKLESLNGDFDYFVCGSDQIWNVQCTDFNPNYMLSFVTDKQKCVAYAPSLGAGACNELTKETISQYTSRFKALSSREIKSSSIIESATQRQVEKVLDPVFLLSSNEWSQIASDKLLKGDYILGYFIGDVAGMRDFAEQLSKSRNLPVVVIYKNLRDLKYNFKNYYEVGPAEFVSLVKNASYVVTNSFHAVSFSLIYKKDFWAFVEPGSSDTRVSDLLDGVGLNDRIVNNCQSNDFLKAIPYSSLDFRVLEDKIETSKKFLINNLD